MTRLIPLALLLLLASPLPADDVFVPPVPKGIATDTTGRIRRPQGPIPFPAQDRPWIRIRSQRLDLLSQEGEERSRELAVKVELLAAALTNENRRFVPAAKRATVFFFDRRVDSQPYFDLLFSQRDAKATGAYVRFQGGGTMLVDGSRKVMAGANWNDRGIRTAMHELLHDLLRQNAVVPPLWLEEGMAEYFGDARIEEGRVVAGGPIPSHVSQLVRRPPMQLDRLFAVQAESAEAATPQFYAQSWAAVHWLMGTNPNAFFPFVHEVERGTPVAAALQTHYGISAAELEPVMRWRKRVKQLVVLTGAKTPPAIEPAQPVDRATLLFELGSFLSRIAGAEAEAERHYREALRIDPRHARTLAALGRLEEAVAAAPNDAEIHLWYAETLLTTALGPFASVFEPAGGDRAAFLKARSLAERALQLDAAFEGLARGILGTTYLVEEDLSPGIAALERAHALLPQRMDFALNLYSMYLRSGQRNKAAELFAATFEHARDPQTKFAARNVLMISETARANALGARGQLEEAAAIIRELATATPDSRGRRELEAHAAQLEATASVNRHIAQYNEAIVLSNLGKNREAMVLLDALLANATDAAVLADVKKLRAELKKR